MALPLFVVGLGKQEIEVLFLISRAFRGKRLALDINADEITTESRMQCILS